MVFPTERVAVFLDGCFWHRCPKHGTSPRANKDWWRAKLDRNVERDQETDEVLRHHGWQVIRVWEHEEVNGAADRVERMVRALRDGKGLTKMA